MHLATTLHKPLNFRQYVALILFIFKNFIMQAKIFDIPTKRQEETSF